MDATDSPDSQTSDHPVLSSLVCPRRRRPWRATLDGLAMGNVCWLRILGELKESFGDLVDSSFLLKHKHPLGISDLFGGQRCILEHLVGVNPTWTYLSSLPAQLVGEPHLGAQVVVDSSPFFCQYGGIFAGPS